MSFPARIALTCTPLTWVAATSLAQPIPPELRTGGMLVSDQGLDAVYRLVELSGDDDADDPGEVTVYFDATNQSGIGATTASVFSIFASACGEVFIADGDSDRVYRLVDRNGDGEAQDVGEATIWFSSANAAGLTLPTPNGVTQDAAGATYITNAGTGALPADYVLRTIDLNGDGDAEDVGEASVWIDLTALQTSSSSAFDIVFAGDVAYLTDLLGGDPDVVHRAEDADGSGAIEADELTTFIDDNNAFGVPVGIPLASDGLSLYVAENTPSVNPQTVYRLTDLNSSGTIDMATEVEVVWSEELVPAPLELNTLFAIAVGPGAELALTSSGSDAQDNIFRLVDLTADGDFLDEGETLAWVTGNGAAFAEQARSVQYMLPPTAVGIVSANPPLISPYFPSGSFMDVLDTGTGPVLTAGIGGEGTLPQGGIEYAPITVTFTAAPSPAPAPCTIAVSCTDIRGNGDGDCPQVTDVTGTGAGPYQISLSHPIPARECTTLTFLGVDPEQRIQYRSLPGDSNLGGQTNTQDLLTLVSDLNSGAALNPNNYARYNINRSTGVNPVNTQDLLRMIQLLNGVLTTQVFNQASVAVCPE